jgi:uncharacterized protein YcfJ
MANRKLWRAPGTAAAMVAILALGIPGCTGPGQVFGSGYAIASDDACAAQRQSLKSFQDYFFSSMIQGAAIGAATGALTGLLIGGDTKGALIGAGAGAVVGGIGGYYVAKQKANNDPVALTNSVYQDVSHENRQIDAVSIAFVQLRDCRLHSAEMVKSDYAAKKISQQDAQSKLQRIKGLFLEDVAFAEGLGSKMAERGGEYQNASGQIMQMNPNAQQTYAAREAAAGGAGVLVANEAARVREAASTSSRQVGTIPPGEEVTVVEGGSTPAEWTHVRLADGRSGFVASRLMRPAGTAAPAKALPPPDAAGVAQLTQSNQLKRKALSDEIAQARTEANSGAFELSGGISRLPPAAVRGGAA